MIDSLVSGSGMARRDEIDMGQDRCATILADRHLNEFPWLLITPTPSLSILARVNPDQHLPLAILRQRRNEPGKQLMLTLPPALRGAILRQGL